MRKIFIYVILLTSYQAWSQNTPFAPYYVNNQVLNMGTTNIYSGQITAPDTALDADWYNGSTRTTLTATDYIILAHNPEPTPLSL